MKWEGTVEASILHETKYTDLVILLPIASILKMMPHLERKREIKRKRKREREREREGKERKRERG